MQAYCHAGRAGSRGLAQEAAWGESYYVIAPVAHPHAAARPARAPTIQPPGASQQHSNTPTPDNPVLLCLGADDSANTSRSNTQLPTDRKAVLAGLAVAHIDSRSVDAARAGRLLLPLGHSRS